MKPVNIAQIRNKVKVLRNECNQILKKCDNDCREYFVTSDFKYIHSYLQENPQACHVKVKQKPK